MASRHISSLRSSPALPHRRLYRLRPPLPLSPRRHPFAFPGSLVYNKTNPFVTSWTPTSAGQVGAARSPPRLMEQLLLKVRGEEQLVKDASKLARLDRTEEDQDLVDDLEWLRGRTVLLMGDSLDRYHLLHLCQFLSPSAPLHPVPWPHSNPEDFITIYSPTKTPEVYPERLVELEKDLSARLRNGREYGSPQSRPWVCRIPNFDAVIVWGFWNGLDDGASTPGLEDWVEPNEGRSASAKNIKRDGAALVGQEGTWGQKARDQPFGDRAFFPIESEHFNPPLSPEDRIKDMMLPLLRNLGRGSARRVDMIEIGVGAWDLGMFRTQDTLLIQSHLPSTLTNSTLLFQHGTTLTSSPLSDQRLAWYASRLRTVLDLASSLFPPNHPSRPRISVRTMPVPPQWYPFPWVLYKGRVKQIEEATKRVVKEANEARGRSGETLRFSGWAEAVNSQGGEWLDHIHPGPIPASWLWADMMLYELRKIVTGLE